ncbi:MAG TPA: hypothetical protein VIH21_08890 [Dehalococcoidia bacterium]|jgi:hypothetical protein
MTPAHSGAAQRSLNTDASDVARRLAGALVPQRASIYTKSGQYVTGGMVEFSGSPSAWTATLRQLDRPGVIASQYFADGLREVTLELEDGRRARARITATSFVAASQRICELLGCERIA